MSDILSLFPDTYEASRERFRNNLALIQDNIENGPKLELLFSP